MNESKSTTVRPVPRWLHTWVIVMAFWTFVLLIAGQLVTTFRAGMADPVWPTEPWYLLASDDASVRERYMLDFGFFVEHSHRIIGWILGGMAIVFAIGLWWGESRPSAWWLGLAGLFILILGYGIFHKAMRDQAAAAQPVLPKPAMGMMVISFAVVGLIGLTGVAGRVKGSGLRLMGLFVLTAIMIQGLLGGLRVRLDAWFGTNLATIHGIFGQVVFALIVAMAGLTALRRFWPVAEDAVRRRMNAYSLTLLILVFLQLVWGAQIRHAPTPGMQRLHFLTAFAVVALAVWMLKSASMSSEGRESLGVGRWILGFLLVLQVALGVEAWMGKFGTGMLPELEMLTSKDMSKAVTRTLHTLIGSGILATAAALFVRTGYVLTSKLQMMPDGAVDGRSSVSGRMPQPVMAGGPQLGETP